MPSILDTGTALAKADAAKTAAPKRGSLEFDLAGHISGTVTATKGPLTFTAYVKALVRGPQKSVTAGGRIEF